MLPKVQFAVKSLPKVFSIFLERGKPRLPVKSVRASVFLWQRGRFIWRRILAISLVPLSTGHERECSSPHEKHTRT